VNGGIELRHDRGVTTLVAGAGVLADAVQAANDRFVGRAIFAISSPGVLEHHAAALAPLAAAGTAFHLLEAPDGEPAKRLAVAERLWESLAATGGKRDSVIVAFGGGSIGDLAGFVAAAFLRGVAFVQVPTTLLAQVDAAIGGKTGVDLEAGKNLVGAFHHPELVVADTRFLATLPRRELRSGLVEAIKMAALLDLDLLARIERDLPGLLAGDPALLAPVVRAAAAAKVAVVERDPYEGGERQLLNFGHTLGHALETEAGYGHLAHGDAVAWGIRFANRLARLRGADVPFLDRLERLLDRLESPIPPALDDAALLARMARDKKARESGLTWILALGPGRGARVADLPAERVAAELRGFTAALRALRPTV
jgi:3-dehydroquinate synthase